MIDVTMLGTAATMPLPGRALTSVYLAYNGRAILFDCGEGTQTAARKAGVSLMKIDLIALTHFHGDHIFGLPGMLQSMGCLGRTAPLYVIGPKGLGAALKPVLALSGPMPFPIYALPLPEKQDSGAFSVADYIAGWPFEAYVEFFRTDHRVESLGYKFSLSRPGKFSAQNATALGVPQNQWGILQHGEAVSLESGAVIEPGDVLGPPRRGLSIVVSGDTSPCDSLKKASQDADLLICDATYGSPDMSSQDDKYGHSTFYEDAVLAKECNVRNLWLTHFSQMMEDPDEYLPNASDVFPNAVCAEDGMTITLNFDE